MRKVDNRFGKLMFCCLFVAFLLLPGTAQADYYCNSQGYNTYYEWINKVSVGSFANLSGPNGGYGDFTNQTIDLFLGPNPIVLAVGFNGGLFTEYWRVWIDLNQDGNFTSDEIVYSGAGSGTLFGNIFINETAQAGLTRMRVSMKWGGYPAACGNFSYGEVEDYAVYISPTDTTSPSVTAVNPVDEATEVPVDTSISVTFSEPMDSATIDETTLSVNDGFDQIAGSITYSGLTATFTPAQALTYETVYTVTVRTGAKDMAGNPLVADYIWSFTTTAPDIISPEIDLTSPQDNETDVGVDFVIQAMFTEPMDPETINNSTFLLTDGSVYISGTIHYSGKTAQFYPSEYLNFSTVYQVTVTTGVKDLAGNGLSADYSWSFTTREFQPDYCAAYATNANYEWIKEVKIGSFSVISGSGSGYSDYTNTLFSLSRTFSNTVELTPGFSGSSYYEYWRVFIDWNQDGGFSADEFVFSGVSSNKLNGSISIPDNALTGNTRMRVSMKYGGWPGPCGSFTYGEVEDFRVNVPEKAGDTTSPTVSSIDPLANAEQIPVSTAITAVFSEAMDPATISDETFQVSDGTNTIAGTVMYDDQNDTATFTPLNDLAFFATYVVQISTGVKDLAGNGLDNDYTWSFTTEPEPGPTYQVSGHIEYGGAELEGATVVLQGSVTMNAMTDDGGNYLFEGVSPGMYTVTPGMAGYAFIPESADVEVLDEDIVGIDFLAEPVIGEFVNGDFETGDLTGYTTFTTSNGYMVTDVVLFDTDNNGSATYSAKFNVGQSSYSYGEEEGGGIYQTVHLSSGDLYLTADIAAIAPTDNGAAGYFAVFFDGQLMDSHNFGSISANTTLYHSLEFTIADVQSGPHEIRFQITRPYLTGPVSNYIDNIVLTGSSVNN